MTPIYLAETPLRLLEAMAGDIAEFCDPWARHWLVLPGKGRSEWVQRRWADAAGIASHSQIVDVRSLVEQAGAAGQRPFSIDRLTLAVAGAIPGLAAKLPLPEGSDWPCGRSRGGIRKNPAPAADRVQKLNPLVFSCSQIDLQLSGGALSYSRWSRLSALAGSSFS